MNKSSKWAYEEKGLDQRINTHDKYAKYEVNDWILEKLHLQPGERVLDVGCGSGKQTIAYARKFPLSLVVGTDISPELLQEATTKAGEEKLKISFIKHDSNLPFSFNDNSFDVTSCCFAIYYYSDIQKFLLEMKRVLSQGGRIFIAGPTVENAKEMISLHAKITGQEVPQMREKRMRDEIIPRVKKLFKQVKVSIFDNPVTFPDGQSFLDYYASTLYFEESSSNPAERAVYLRKMKEQVDKTLKKNGTFVLNKQVYGILGYK